MQALKCVSTGNEITNDSGSVRFPCPKCGEEIVRSRHSRQLGTKYICKKCGFEGPN